MSAASRLLRELKLLQREPVPGVFAYPHEDEVHTLCLVLQPQQGRLKGLRLHFDVTFPSGYPLKPPVVRSSTRILHRNFFSSGWICCDILDPGLAQYDDGYNGGYSPAYTLSSLFLQLLSFLTAEEVESAHTGTKLETTIYDHGHIEKMSAEKFTCTKCAYNQSGGILVVDNEKEWRQNQADWSRGQGECEKRGTKATPKPHQERNEEMVGKRVIVPDEMHRIIPDIWLKIADNLSDTEVHRLSQAVPTFGQLMYSIQMRKQTVCFVTRQSFHECTLGIGIVIHGRNISSTYDILSYDTFQSGHRQGVWGGKFTHFLPLALEPGHFEGAVPLLLDCVDKIAERLLSPSETIRLNGLARKNPGGTGVSRSPAGTPLLQARNPHTASLVLRKMLNQILVKLMKDCDAWEESKKLAQAGMLFRTVIHASEQMMNGYFHIIHLLLSLAHHFPELKGAAEASLLQFKTDENARTKHETPDLGEFVAQLYMSADHSWKDVFEKYFTEMRARNVFWCLDPDRGKGKGYLAYLEEQELNTLRMEDTFESSKTALRMLMFQNVFVSNLGNFFLDDHSNTDCYSPSTMRYILQNTYGYPAAGVAARLVDNIKQIYRVRTWSELYGYLEMGDVPTDGEICGMLRAAVRESARKRYHHCHLNKDELLVWRSMVDKKIPKEERRKVNKQNVRHSVSDMKMMTFTGQRRGDVRMDRQPGRGYQDASNGGGSSRAVNTRNGRRG
ncbi:uncharacterized protein EV422DRAFT_502298 [Fimicolochytrium jonesii]|uniref:uncharacterized protein n=1 Tax=Fimicolochytrium jonesii TaxID=1396493 RepID=UPI0022FEAF74|nr:uncharacterized protein EV422DRAFT_502298 [Fimicolochytrium jonesii]KAI8815530.1 hypothetical protein EV422DRAFT_502298 [Fimicolochytrium jonesii]